MGILVLTKSMELTGRETNATHDVQVKILSVGKWLGCNCDSDGKLLVILTERDGAKYNSKFLFEFDDEAYAMAFKLQWGE